MSSVTAVFALSGSDTASALPLTQYKLTAQPSTQTIEAGTGIATINAFAEYKFSIGGWNDFRSPLSATTISAESATAEISTNQIDWLPAASLTADRFYKAEGTFYVKSNTVGSHAVNLTTSIQTTEGVRDLSTTVNVNVEDTVKPYFEILSPNSGDTVGAGIVNIQVRITEEGSGVDFGNTYATFFEQSSFGTPGQVQTASVHLTPTATPGIYTASIDTTGHDGVYRLGVSGRDNAGNSRSTAKTNITIDNTIPTFTLTDDGDPRQVILDGAVINPAYLGDKDSNGDTIRFAKESASDTLYVNGVKINAGGYIGHTSGQIGWKFTADGAYTLFTRDLVGNQSTSLTFTVDTVAPDMPEHISPANNHLQNFNNFYFDWTDVADAVEYEFQSSQNPSVDGEGALNVGVWNNKSSADRNYLTDSEIHSYGANGTWYWQVRAIDAAGNKSDWTTPWKMTIDMEKPSAPVIETPANNQYFNTGNILNKWSASTDASGILGYQIAYQYDDGHAFGGANTCAGETAATLGIGVVGKFIGCRDVAGTQRTHVPGISEQGGVTIWVRAQDNAGNWSNWSDSVHYIYDATAPAVPSSLVWTPAGESA
ncbi:MAG TPA: hypothetical protein PLY16_00445, partial [Candidatus Saccharibacteria bacterium]|nr:hypothetical protein [Candidatus Saccharibacteria bacterium]